MSKPTPEQIRSTAVRRARASPELEQGINPMTVEARRDREEALAELTRMAVEDGNYWDEETT